MNYKLYISIFILSINLSYSNIIYNKNEILITDIELNSYKNLYKKNFQKDISNNVALKNIVLIKQTIGYLLDNNPEFMNKLDKSIKSEFNKDIFNDQSILNFVRFQKIRNEFITEYFQNSFNFEDFKKMFSKLNDTRILISKNDCLTIEKSYEIDTDEYLIKSLFQNFKNNKKKFTISINNESYEACVDSALSKKIEDGIVKYIEEKTDGDFKNFIYGNIN